MGESCRLPPDLHLFMLGHLLVKDDLSFYVYHMYI